MPELGFYYHYKHDARKDIQNYAYEVIGVARHTEDEGYLVLYRPLYETEFIGEAHCFARPLAMFMEDVEINCQLFSRFRKITDKAIVEQLEHIRDALY